MADVLPDLYLLNVRVTVSLPVLELPPCTACLDSGEKAGESVAEVVVGVSREACCVVCLLPIVRFELAGKRLPVVEVPLSIGPVTT